MAHQQRADSVGNQFSGDKNDGDDNRRHDDINRLRKVYQHPDGHKEQGGEHVPHRTHYPVELLGVMGVAQDRPDQECPRRGRKPQLLGRQGQAETQGQPGDQQGLVRVKPVNEVDQPGREEGAEHQRDRPEYGQLCG